jgi:predicted RNase H-like nuclease (RuvC/YqgF family)
LNAFSSALTEYASHEHTIREALKQVRKREEDLDELKRRRKTVVGKADSAERKLSKMSNEHKNAQMQTEALNKLQDEIRQLGSEIMIEEASLSDFKRTTARIALGVKFGGLQECCEKGTICAEYGKLVASVSTVFSPLVKCC